MKRPLTLISKPTRSPNPNPKVFLTNLNPETVIGAMARDLQFLGPINPLNDRTSASSSEAT